MRITEVATLTGLSARQIRYYQNLGVLPEPKRSPGRHRRFSDRDVGRLTLLKSLLGADVPPALAARVAAGRASPTERRHVDRMLEGHAAASQHARSQLAVATRKEPGAQPDISLMFDVFVLRTRMGAVLTAALAGAEVGAGEYALLSLLASPAEMTATEIARQLGSAPATLGRQLAELVRHGSLTRSVDSRDRRRVLFALTTQGEQRYRSALPLAAGVAAGLDRGLRERGLDPDTARSVLRTLSDTLTGLIAQEAPARTATDSRR